MDESPERAPPLRVICVDAQPSDAAINLLEDSPDLRSSHRQPETRIPLINLTRHPSASSAMMRTLLSRYGAAPVADNDLAEIKAPKSPPPSHSETQQGQAIAVPPELPTSESAFTFSPHRADQGSTTPSS